MDFHSRQRGDRRIRPLPVGLVLVAVLTSCGGCELGAAAAAQPGEDASGRAAAGTDAGAGATSKGADAGESPPAGEGAPVRSNGTALAAALSPPAPDDASLQALRRRRERLRATADALAAEIRTLRQSRERSDAGLEMLNRQLDGSGLPASAASTLRSEAATTRARMSLLSARAAALGRIRAGVTGAIAALDRIGGLMEPEARLPQTGRREAEEAREAAARARRQYDEARRQERRARSAEIRKLLAERSEKLKRIAELSSEQHREIEKLAARRAETETTFATRQEEIEGKLRDVPPEPSSRVARERVDPLFETLRSYREEAREAYAEASDRLQSALAEEREAQSALERGERELERVRERGEQLANERLRRRRLELEKTEVKLRRRRRDKASSIVDARRESLELHARRIDYYSSVLERVLPKISERARDRYFSPWRSQNWENLAASFRETRRAFTRKLELRMEQARSMPNRLFSPELWGALFGLAWRLLLFPVAGFLLREYLVSGVHRLVNLLLQRPFFRTRAAGTIKLGELLRTLAWPLALLGVTHLVASYVVGLLPELAILHTFVHIGFAYWIAMATLKVFLLPRAYREREDGPAPELGRVTSRARRGGEDVVDLFDLEAERAQKGVSTARLILIFVLAAWFVPRLVLAVVGHTIAWSVVRTAFRWAVLGVVYYELSNWRDEIASLFGELAGDRVPGIADFVDRQKDRIWGVLVIALASVFVVFAELWRALRRYVVETEISGKVTNFLFRKQIEMKQRDDEANSEDEQEPHEELPEDYRALYADRPLGDVDYRLDRDHVFEEILEPWEEWKERPQQGSMAVTGEVGMGKSTLLNRFCEHVLQEDVYDPTFVALTSKIVTTDGLIAYLADLFDLETVPPDRDELVERLLERERRVVVIDDCHHLFFRKIQGFEGLALFLDIVNLTDHHHFWLLTFNKYGWKYLQRVQERKHFFGYTCEIDAWSADELQEAVERRNETLPYEISFSDLVVTRGRERDNHYEVVQTANGYFRLLQEFSQGNPRVALDFWVRNLRVAPDGTLNVNLFRRPSLEELSGVTENHLFALTALVQHGALSAEEVAEIVNTEVGFCEMALNYFQEVDVVDRERSTGRYHLTAFFYRPVVERLTSSNFLWS